MYLTPLLIFLITNNPNIHPNYTMIVLVGVYLLFVCLFDCLFGVYRPTRDFSLIWTRHHYRCSALMTIEQWRFCSVPHLLWHGASVYNGHLEGPVTFTLVAERLAVELSLTFFYYFYVLCLSRLGFEHPTLRLWGQRSNPLRHHLSR